MINELQKEIYKLRLNELDHMLLEQLECCFSVATAAIGGATNNDAAGMHQEGGGSLIGTSYLHILIYSV